MPEMWAVRGDGDYRYFGLRLDKVSETCMIWRYAYGTRKTCDRSDARAGASTTSAVARGHRHGPEPLGVRLRGPGVLLCAP